MKKKGPRGCCLGYRDYTGAVMVGLFHKNHYNGSLFKKKQDSMESKVFCFLFFRGKTSNFQIQKTTRDSEVERSPLPPKDYLTRRFNMIYVGKI